MATVPIRLRDEDVKRLDRLVKSGRFRNRNEAIRHMIGVFLERAEAEKSNVDFARVARTADKLRKLRNPITDIAAGMSVEELMMEERGA